MEQLAQGHHPGVRRRQLPLHPIQLGGKQIQRSHGAGWVS
jgi:hypothetical protein